MTEYKETLATKIGESSRLLAQKIRKWRKYNVYIIIINVLLIVGSIIGNYYIADRNWGLAFNIIIALLSTWLGFYMCINIIEIINYGGNTSNIDSKRNSQKAIITNIKKLGTYILLNILYPIGMFTLFFSVIIYFLILVIPGSSTKLTESPLNIASIIISLGSLLLLIYSSSKLKERNKIIIVKSLLLAGVSFIATYLLILAGTSPILDTAIKTMQLQSQSQKTMADVFIYLLATVTDIFMVIGALSLAIGLISVIDLIRKM